MNDTKQHLIQTAKRLFAAEGYEGLSMRTLAHEAGISSSVTYHYFSDKDVLLKEIFDTTNTQLGKIRSKLPAAKTLKDALEQRVNFQFTHAEDVSFVLKYYLHFRSNFSKTDGGYVPPKAYLHIEEVLEFGAKTKTIDPNIEIASQAKIITHAINGFVLEYYPNLPTGQERKKIVRDITDFIYRSIERRNPATSVLRKPAVT